MHEFVYFGRSIPWIIIDALPYFRRWKLQDVPSLVHPRSNTDHVDQNPYTRRSMDVYKVCPATTFHGRVTSDIPVPSNSSLLWSSHRCSLPRHHDHGIAIFVVMEDTFHYWAHRGLHWGPLYKNIHKIHHQYSAPFGLAAEYAHPAEVFILGLGTVGSPILFCAITHNLHLITMYLWITLRYLLSFMWGRQIISSY